MNLTNKDIAKFQALYIKHFNIKLDKLEAMDKLSKLVRQMEIAYQPITLSQLKELVDKDDAK